MSGASRGEPSTSLCDKQTPTESDACFFDNRYCIAAPVCVGKSAAPFPLSEALLRSRFNLNSCALHPPCDPCAREVKPFSSRDETFFIVSAHLYSRDKKGGSYVRGVAI